MSLAAFYVPHLQKSSVSISIPSSSLRINQVRVVFRKAGTVLVDICNSVNYCQRQKVQQANKSLRCAAARQNSAAAIETCATEPLHRISPAHHLQNISVVSAYTY
ncbi:hypothetical protein E4U55_002027 [Claviceps digitariae]|nr:hypothetical protein E4U55_002027 [Claviceps digitariae]